MIPLVGTIAVVELLAIGLFAAAAITGDDWGIARAMASLLAVPFIGLTVPGLLLLRRGHRRSAAALAIASVPVTGLLWRLA